MKRRQYTFSLPEHVGVLVDAQPRSTKSQYVADALLLKAKCDAQHNVLALLDEIKPKKGISDKSSVELIRDARDARARQLIDNPSC